MKPGCEAERFLAAQIDDPGPVPVLPRDFEKQSFGGPREAVFGHSGGVVAAAVHFSTPYAGLADARLPAISMNTSRKSAVMRDFVMLRSIAVAQVNRGSALGRRLPNHVEEYAFPTGRQVIYEVCGPTSRDFSETIGYAVGASRKWA